MKRLLLASALLLPVAAHAELSPLLGVYNADNVTLYAGKMVYPSGAFAPMGVLYTTTATASTATGTTEQTLGTYSLPANGLDQVGRRMHVHAVFSFGANTNVKTVKLYFGASVITSPGAASNGTNAVLDLDIVKTGASTQIVSGTGVVALTPVTTYYNAGTDTDTAAIVIKATATDATSSAADVVLDDLFVQYMN